MRVLLASDGSPAATGAARWLRDFPLPQGSSFLILTVVIVPAETTLPHQLADLLRDEGRSAAERTWRA
ncbi:MAG: hypothetical protein ACRELZ_20320, partial [Candidatus Rokuibacteriota bacterium]